MGDDRNAFLGEELLHNKRWLAGCVIVMKKPLSLPLVAPFLPNCIAQPLQNLHVEMTTVLFGSWSEWLLAFPYSENGPQGDAFRNHGGHQNECDGRTPEDSKRSLPPVLPTMAGSMEQVCVRARVLFWRWLAKRCHMSYHWSAKPHFRELFDCLLYNLYHCIETFFNDQAVLPQTCNTQALRHLHSLFQSQFCSECDLVLPLGISS